MVNWIDQDNYLEREDQLLILDAAEKSEKRYRDLVELLNRALEELASVKSQLAEVKKEVNEINNRTYEIEIDIADVVDKRKSKRRMLKLKR